MPEVGLEPTCPCGREILSLVRIPISPLRLGEDDRCWGEGESTARHIFAGVPRGLNFKGKRAFMRRASEKGVLCDTERRVRLRRAGRLDAQTLPRQARGRVGGRDSR